MGKTGYLPDLPVNEASIFYYRPCGSLSGRVESTSAHGGITSDLRAKALTTIAILQ